jgi:hypothetical protein
MATSPTIRLRPSTHRALKQVAEWTGTSMQDARARAVDEYERAVYFAQLNAGYAELQKDPKAWQEV